MNEKMEMKMSAETTKDTNPKEAVGSNKLPLHLWPTTATAMGSVGMLNGLLKYGRANFRASGVQASTYIAACHRHLDLWFEGEECDADDLVPHLAAALSCIAIIIDARAAGKLNDDRMYPGGYRKLVDELTPHVARLKALHADRHPKHYTIGDSHEQLDQGCNQAPRSVHGGSDAKGTDPGTITAKGSSEPGQLQRPAGEAGATAENPRTEVSYLRPVSETGGLPPIWPAPANDPRVTCAH